MPEAAWLRERAFFADCRAPVTVVAQEPTPRRLLEIHERHTRSTEYAIGPETIGDGTPARLAASLDIVVRLEPRTDWPDGVLEDLSDYYLHSPTLRVPIEPFGVFARSLGGGGAATLFDHYREVLGVHFHVDGRGRVSLSERWARAGHFFGTTEDDLETLRASALWRRLAERRDALFTSLSPCSTCPHYAGCGGFWRALDERPDACAAWQRAFDAVREAWRSSREEAATGS